MTAIDKYLDFVKHNRAHRSYLTYRYTLDTLLRESDIPCRGRLTRGLPVS
jgi:hypothetical protein